MNLDLTEAERALDRELRESKKVFNRLEDETVEEGRRRPWTIRGGRITRLSENRTARSHVTQTTRINSNTKISKN